MPFERGWLAGTLARAAERAGYKKWWLAPHVTESVTNYLEQDFEESVVTVNRLEKAVQSVLQVIGYADVAGHFCAVPPPARRPTAARFNTSARGRRAPVTQPGARRSDVRADGD